MYDRSLLARSVAGKNRGGEAMNAKAILAAMAVTLVLTAVRFWPRPPASRADPLLDSGGRRRREVTAPDDGA